MAQMIGLRQCLLPLFLLVAIVAAPAALAAQQQADTTVHAIGGSRVRGGDMSAAREEAISAGLVAAVHNVVADLLPPETMTGNFQAINEAVLNRTDRFVRDYKVLAQSTVAATYRVHVQATVAADRIREALRTAGIRLEARQYPRILFCIAESQVHDLQPRYWWDGRTGRDDTVAGATLSRAFAAAGFEVVRPTSAAAATSYPPELRATEAVALGREFKAEIVVVGLAMAEATGHPGERETPSFRGSITVRAYRVSDGQQIAQTQRAMLAAAADAQAGGREALSKAAALAAEDLTAHIDTAWFRQKAAGTRIEMVVHGISGNMANFVRFRGALTALSGVDRLQIREMTADAAVLMVDYQGSSRALADALLVLGFEAFRVSIAEVDAGTIQLQLVPR